MRYTTPFGLDGGPDMALSLSHRQGAHTNTQERTTDMAKHLNNYMEADTGLSFFWYALCTGREPKHAAPMAEWEPPTYEDAWAGNADTDKYWSK